jgi:hypothetical protein
MSRVLIGLLAFALAALASWLGWRTDQMRRSSRQEIEDWARRPRRPGK